MMKDEIIIKNMTAKVIEKDLIKDEKLARILMETYIDVHNLLMKTIRNQFESEERYYSEYYELLAHCLDNHITCKIEDMPEYKNLRDNHMVYNDLSHLSNDLSEFETEIYNLTNVEHPEYISWSVIIKEEEYEEYGPFEYDQDKLLYVRNIFWKKLTNDHEDKILEIKNKFFNNPKYLPIIQDEREQIIKKIEELLKKEGQGHEKCI